MKNTKSLKSRASAGELAADNRGGGGGGKSGLRFGFLKAALSPLVLWCIIHKAAL